MSRIEGQSFGNIEMVRFAAHEQLQQRTVEQVVILVTDQGTVEVPNSQILKDTVESDEVASSERGQQRTVEVPLSQL